MFYLTVNGLIDNQQLGTEFPKYSQVKQWLEWYQYRGLCNGWNVENCKLVQRVQPAHVNWNARPITEFWKIVKEGELKVSFFGIDAFLKVTKDVSDIVLGELLRKRIAVCYVDECVYVLE